MAKHPRIRAEWLIDKDGYARLADARFLPKKGKFYALAWTWRNFRMFRTKSAAQDALKRWKAWQERRGWTVMGSLSAGYTATHPGYRPVLDSLEPGVNVVSACVQTYDAETKQRLA